MIKKFQDAWTAYTAGNISFKEFYQRVSFGILVYPTVVTIFAQMTSENPVAFEKLLLDLYDESKDLKQRITDYTTGFADVYYTLLTHGKNTFQEERTIATLLAFRYPEKYTFFKDSFYTKLCKGLGIKPYPKGEKIFHYYSLVNDFVTNHLQKHPDIIEEKNNRLDETCYKDQKNLILAQDILFLTLDAKETEDNDDGGIQPPKPSSKKTAMKSALNQILYGPPGTGKTYHTINKSVAIANPDFGTVGASREELKTEYEKLVKDGQIEFITFHQSMTYEDFIEGIKPMEPKEGDPFLNYEIKQGIFKRLCDRASKVPETKSIGFSISDDEFQKAGFYKLSLGDTSNPDDDQIYSWCIKNGYIALGYGDAIDFTGKNENEIQQMVPAQLEKYAAQAVNYFIHYLKAGDYVVVTYGNLQFRAIGKVTGNYEYKNVNGLNVHQLRRVEWMLKDIGLPYEEVYNKQFSQRTIYRLNKNEIKKDFFVKAATTAKSSDNKVKNYVLIIDEINRGNVSQIFGELITLIEEDKRAGKNEALTATLPYSKKTFSVPPNLYIIGTMNTADRSVEALDTALRRRFAFEEMLPNSALFNSYYLLKQLWIKYKHTYDGDEEWEVAEKSFGDLFGMNFINKKKYNDLKPKENNVDDELNKINPDDLQQSIQFKDGVDLEEMLKRINARLMTLNSKDHTIGHAWLMNVLSIEDLQAAFKNKILPLLQEFFYNDYAKIGLVLGKKFVVADKVETKLFADFDDGNELASEYADNVIYTLQNPFYLKLEDFMSIYK